jgi:uncharacterized membrane protein
MHRHFSEISARRRLLYAALAAGLTLALPLPLRLPTRGLLAWCAGCICYLVLAWWLAHSFNVARTRARAQAQDQSGAVLFLLLFASVFASALAVAFMLHQLDGLSRAERTGHLMLSMLVLAVSWLLMQTIFAFRYAHRYYLPEAGTQAHAGGLEFPGLQPPDYFDFLYYAGVVGMTSQVSDVVVTSRSMRRLTLLHSVSAFAFNMLVLALSINVMAGAL